jgi:hypothetical protein
MRATRQLRAILINKNNVKTFKESEDIATTTTNNTQARREQHPFHIVDNSIVPFVVALGAFVLTGSIALFFNEYLHYKVVRALLMFFFLLIVE